ncbi:MAG: transglycosylase SLT domain-containing protein [Luteimonas sp.]
MLPGMELMGCAGLAVPAEVMHHVVRVESSYNPFAIGVVGGRLARQPRSLEEALSTSRMLEREGYNFSLGLAQVNRHNLRHHGLDSHEKAFDICPNLRAGAQILSECHTRAGGDWGKAFSCYYSGNFVTGYQHGYVQKVLASWQAVAPAHPIPVIRNGSASVTPSRVSGVAAPSSRVASRVQEAARTPRGDATGPATAIAGQAAPTHVPVNLQANANAQTPPVRQMPGATSPQADDDAPVTVRLTSAPPQQVASSASPPHQPEPSGPPADTAFVF